LKIKLGIFVVFFILVAAGCSLLQPTPVTENVPTVENILEPTIQAAPTTEPLLTETDACKLFNELKACQVLGEPAIPPVPANSTGYSVCPFFTSTGKGIYVAITSGDQAKKNLLNEISQYQIGCSVSYSGGTSTATPFPPAIEALMIKPVLELYKMNIDLQAKCGAQIEPLPEFGPDAYAYLTSTGLQMGTIAIVAEDRIYTFSYADPILSIPEMVEKAKEVARAVFLPDPAVCPAPSSSTPDQGSVPEPVSSPTWIGPTQVQYPTPIGGGPTPVH
jgi:hypothetical protein